MKEAKFRPTPLLEWCAEVDAQAYSPWLLHDFIKPGCLTLISGAPKRTKKSYAVFGMAVALATGEPVGPFLPWNVGVQRNVLGVFEEGGAKDTKERLLKICKGAGLELHNAASITMLFRQGFKLNTDSKWLCAYVAEMKPAVVILDPFYRVFNGNENDAQDVSAAIDVIAKLQRMGTAVVLITHTSKAGDALDIDDRIRGSSVLAGAYDIHLGFSAKDGALMLTARSKEDEEKVFKVNWRITAERAALNLIRQVPANGSTSGISVAALAGSKAHEDHT